MIDQIASEPVTETLYRLDVGANTSVGGKSPDILEIFLPRTTAVRIAKQLLSALLDRREEDPVKVDLHGVLTWNDTTDASL